MSNEEEQMVYSLKVANDSTKPEIQRRQRRFALPDLEFAKKLRCRLETPVIHVYIWQGPANMFKPAKDTPCQCGAQKYNEL